MLLEQPLIQTLYHRHSALSSGNVRYKLAGGCNRYLPSPNSSSQGHRRMSRRSTNNCCPRYVREFICFVTCSFCILLTSKKETGNAAQVNITEFEHRYQNPVTTGNDIVKQKLRFIQISEGFYSLLSIIWFLLFRSILPN